jgi:hypothetical protein
MSRHKTVNSYIIEPPDAWILCERKDGTVTAVAIDADDAPAARMHKWCVGMHRDSYFAVITSAWTPGVGQKTVVLARYLLNAPHGLEVDHKDRDPLNCRRGNLRIVTQPQNRQNLSSDGMGSLRTRGVTFAQGHYVARVTLDGRLHHLGNFKSLDEARQVVVRFRAERMPFSQDAMQLRGV